MLTRWTASTLRFQVDPSNQSTRHRCTTREPILTVHSPRPGSGASNATGTAPDTARTDAPHALHSHSVPLTCFTTELRFAPGWLTAQPDGSFPAPTRSYASFESLREGRLRVLFCG